VLGDVVEHHLAVDRRDPQQAGQSPQWKQAVLRRDAVSAVRLDRRVHRRQRSLCGGVLRDVRRLAGVQTAIVVPGRSRGRQRGQLDLDLGLRQGVRDPWCAPITWSQTLRVVAFRVALVSAHRPMPTQSAAPAMRSGFADREDDARTSAGQAGQPSLALLSGTELGDDLA
jgi:hypothetical protein